MNEQDALELAQVIYALIVAKTPPSRRSQVISLLQLALIDIANRTPAHIVVTQLDQWDAIYPAAGDTPQAIVEGFEEAERMLLAKLDALKPKQRLIAAIDAASGAGVAFAPAVAIDEISPYDQRWLAIARTDIERGFMALRRAITGD